MVVGDTDTVALHVGEIISASAVVVAVKVGWVLVGDGAQSKQASNTVSGSSGVIILSAGR